MKWLFYILVLANGVFFVWQTKVQTTTLPPTEIVQATPTVSASPLVLLTELRERAKDASPETKKPSTPLGRGTDSEAPELAALPQDQEKPKPIPLGSAEQPPAVPVNACYIIGSIESEVAAERTAKAIIDGGGRVDIQQEKLERTRYGVLLAPARSQSPKSIMTRLERAGFRDYYLIKAGDYRNMLSLGVFSTREAAERRIAQVRALKLKPRLVEVTLPVSRYRLRVRWEGPRDPWPTDVRLPAEPVPCK